MLPNYVSNTALLKGPEADLSFYRPRGSVDFETGWSRDERYLMNKIRSKYLEKMENKINKQ